jgi:hypothetical protein
MLDAQAGDAPPVNEKTETEKLIAGLSLVNTLIHLFEADFQFVVGLGVTLVVDVVAMAVAKESGGVAAAVAKLIAVVVGLLAAGVFVLFGWLANKRKGWAFVLGMVLYLLDGLIFLVVTDWMSLGFHAFALFAIFAGYSACRGLAALEVRTLYKPIAP